MPDAIYLDFKQGIKASSGCWYKCLQLLGTGGSAATFLVICTEGPNCGMLFALKIFRRLSMPRRRQRFLSETQFLAECTHPAIVRVYDSGTYVGYEDNVRNEYPFVITEYLPLTLAAKMKRADMSIVQKLSIAMQLVSALEYLSCRNPQVVHRDIKPQNIFVKGSSCVLGDFGLMKVLDEQDEEDRNILNDSLGGQVPFFYRSPDLVAYAKGESGITPKSDVFQLGLVLAELFTGWNPAAKPQSSLDPVVVEHVSNIPCYAGAGIAAILKRMLVLDPNQREDISKYRDCWAGAFWDVAEKQRNLEGRVL